MALTKEAREYFAKEGRRGGKKAAANMTAKERSEKMRRAAQARWAKTDRVLAQIERDTKAMVKNIKGIGKKSRKPA